MSRAANSLGIVMAWLLFVANVIAAQSLETQTSDVGGVVVQVTPSEVSPSAMTWEFAVVLQTHTVELEQDLAKVSELIDGKGGVHKPLAWSGDPPGGHHRKGMLSFKPIAAPGTVIKLRIKDIGAPERTLQWSLK
jgi:hypothetical protein